jgi:hypothetical protein
MRLRWVLRQFERNGGFGCTASAGPEVCARMRQSPGFTAVVADPRARIGANTAIFMCIPCCSGPCHTGSRQNRDIWQDMTARGGPARIHHPGNLWIWPASTERSKVWPPSAAGSRRSSGTWRSGTARRGAGLLRAFRRSGIAPGTRARFHARGRRSWFGACCDHPHGL